MHAVSTIASYADWITTDEHLFKADRAVIFAVLFVEMTAILVFATSVKLANNKRFY